MKSVWFMVTYCLIDDTSQQLPMLSHEHDFRRDCRVNKLRACAYLKCCHGNKESLRRGACSAITVVQTNQWSNLEDSRFSVEIVSGGITNLLLKVTVREEDGNTILMTVRLYGPNKEYVIDRQRELLSISSYIVMLK